MTDDAVTIAEDYDASGEGIGVVADGTEIEIDASYESGYVGSTLTIAWADLLKYAPPAEMFAALVARGDVIKVKAPCFINGQHLVIITPGETP